MGGIRQCDGKVYCLKNFMVQEYQSIKYLTIAKEGSEIVLIDDLAVVVEEGDRDDELWVIDDVTVGGVPYFDTYKSCLQCVEPHTEHLGKCSKMECMIRKGTIFAHNTPQLNSCSYTSRTENRGRCLH